MAKRQGSHLRPSRMTTAGQSQNNSRRNLRRTDRGIANLPLVTKCCGKLLSGQRGSPGYVEPFVASNSEATRKCVTHRTRGQTTEMGANPGGPTAREGSQPRGGLRKHAMRELCLRPVIGILMLVMAKSTENTTYTTPRAYIPQNALPYDRETNNWNRK